MPPAMSDDESDRGSDDVPARPIKDAPMADADEEDDDEEEGDAVYQVEEILGHKFEKGGILKYKVKWLGYEDEADMTMEPVENLDNAVEAVKAYHLSIGGTPVRGSTKKVKRSASQAFDSPAPTGSQKKKSSRKSQINGASEEFEPPVGSWEDHVVRVAAILEVAETATTKKGAAEIMGLEGLLEWSEQHGNRKTQHSMALLRKKCPQRLLDYYESHL